MARKRTTKAKPGNAYDFKFRLVADDPTETELINILLDLSRNYRASNAIRQMLITAYNNYQAAVPRALPSAMPQLDMSEGGKKPILKGVDARMKQVTAKTQEVRQTLARAEELALAEATRNVFASLGV